MNIGPEQPIDREPLTPEERELAQRLSRLGPSAGPPSTIDARILAAAHDAVAARPRQGARGTRRWPVALGVAASLALAVGIAWRLRPLPEPPQAYNESATSSGAATSAAATIQGPAAAPEPDYSAQAFEVAPAKPSTPIVAQDAEKAESKRESAPPPPADMPIVVDEARASDVASPPPAPPPPPPPVADAAANIDAAAGAALSAQERERMAEAAQAAGAAQRAKSIAAPQPASAEAPLQRREQESTEDIEIVGADDSGDEPPAYANSPQVREAWLQRIRELIAEGSLQQAHDSLHEFQRRYPDQPLPEDLMRFKQSKTDPVAP